MHIDHLSIALTSSHCSRDDDKCILVHEIPYASLALRTVTWLCEQIKFEGGGERKEDEKAEELQQCCTWPEECHFICDIGSRRIFRRRTPWMRG